MRLLSCLLDVYSKVHCLDLRSIFTYVIFREVHMYDTFILSYVPLQFPAVSVLLSDVECMVFEFHKHVVEELDEVI